MTSKQKTRRADGKAAPRVQHPKRRSAPPRRSRPALSPAALLAAALATAALAAGGLVLASQLGAREDAAPSGPASSLAGVEQTEALLTGIPQDGIALGSPDAPVTLVEYADLQCPYCGVWARDVLPALVREYVRPGDVRLVFHGLAFLGPESDTALRAALAAAEQDRLWNVLDLVFHNQGQENGGWVTESFLRQVGQSVPGLDAERMLAEGSTAAVERQLSDSERAARRARVTGTPSFELGPSGGRLQPLVVESLEPAFFRARLDEALGR